METHHFLGVFLAQWGLMCDVKDGDGALLSISKLGSTAREELLRAVQQDVCQVPR